MSNHDNNDKSIQTLAMYCTSVKDVMRYHMITIANIKSGIISHLTITSLLYQSHYYEIELPKKGE
jgi:hypothetical protein